MLQRLYLLLVFHELVLIVDAHVTIGVHALGEHVHGQQPLLLLVLYQVSLLIVIGPSELAHHL